MHSYFGDLIAAMIVAGVATLIVSRICLWLASSLGDSRRRVLVAHVVTLRVGVTAASFALRVGDDPALLRGAVAVLPVQLLWLVWDLGAQRRRRALARVEPDEAEAPTETTGTP